MLIRMTSTCRGVEDGFTLQKYETGRVYYVAQSLACHFLRHNQAIKATPIELVRQCKDDGVDVPLEWTARLLSDLQYELDYANSLLNRADRVLTNPQTHADRGEPL